jgi:hypothetical protein
MVVSATAAAAESSAAAGSSSMPPTYELELNEHAFQRYFDKPEVIKACRAQELIQTPEFRQVPEHASVGGRFRPRAPADDVRLFFVYLA